MATSIVPKKPVSFSELVYVNGVGVPFVKNGRVLGALREAGFEVPTLCYEARLEPQGTCRTCIVEVEVEVVDVEVEVVSAVEILVNIIEVEAVAVLVSISN